MDFRCHSIVNLIILAALPFSPLLPRVKVKRTVLDTLCSGPRLGGIKCCGKVRSWPGPRYCTRSVSFDSAPRFYSRRTSEQCVENAPIRECRSTRITVSLSNLRGKTESVLFVNVDSHTVIHRDDMTPRWNVQRAGSVATSNLISKAFLSFTVESLMRTLGHARLTVRMSQSNGYHVTRHGS